ncbi:MAG TPA: hypothetical protein VKC55_04950 [Actinomycetota bacterium]|nr:hypothetical protein [Actinomycetota bacterium]
MELPGDDFVLWAGDMDTIADEVEEFLTGQRRGPASTRIVATVMFTDIVGSTERSRDRPPPRSSAPERSAGP